MFSKKDCAMQDKKSAKIIWDLHVSNIKTYKTSMSDGVYSMVLV
jgi:hypothetical protein